jgi:hypothetical protein
MIRPEAFYCFFEGLIKPCVAFMVTLPKKTTSRNPALEARRVLASVARMPAMTKALSRLGQQIAEVVLTLDKLGARFALIGGLALAPHKVVRATQDVDLLIDADFAQTVDSELKSIGYECLHRSNDAANYLRGDQRLDFLYAHRPAARQFLTSARELNTPFGTLHVVSAEALIAFKLQGWVNNPRRTQDLEDIRALIRANRDTLDLTETRRYFCMFDRENLLDEMLSELS